MDIIDLIRTNGVEVAKRYYSLYIGVVKSIDDPENRNRILVNVPEVFPDRSSGIWATPRGIIAGPDFGYNYVPKVNEVVLITFRFGHIRHPFWEPGYFAKGEKPEEFTKDVVGFKFRDGSIIMYDESVAKLTVKVKGKTVTVDDTGVTIDAGEQGIIIHNETSSVSITDSGVDINSDKITVGGDNNVLFSKVHGASQILDVSEIGVSSKVKVG